MDSTVNIMAKDNPIAAQCVIRYAPLWQPHAGAFECEVYGARLELHNSNWLVICGPTDRFDNLFSPGITTHETLVLHAIYYHVFHGLSQYD